MNAPEPIAAAGPSNAGSRVGTRRLERSRAAAAIYEPMPIVLSAAGLLIISIAFAMGRSGTSGASIPFWVGQLMLYGSLLWYALRNEYSEKRTVGVVAILGVETYLVKYFYSPLILKYPDELLHWRGTANALASGLAGSSNNGLPISSKYPGLQAVSAVFVRASGLNLDAAGFVLALAMKVAFLLALVMFFRQLGGSQKYALIAMFVYACNNGFVFFNSMYVYENLALPYLACTLCLVRAVQSLSISVTKGTLLACACVSLTIVSHHIAAMFLVGILVVLAATQTYWRRREGYVPRATIIVALYGAAALGLWLAFVSPQIGSYLTPYTVNLTSGSNSTNIYPATPTHIPAVTRPILDLVVGRLGIVVVGVFVMLGIALILRRRHDAWSVTLGILSLSIFGTGAVALVSSRGGEIAGRFATFSYVGIAAVIGFFVVSTLTDPTKKLRSALVWCALVVAYLGAVANGWPSWWDRLPGSFYARGSESGVDGHILRAADWVGSNLGRDNNFVGDANGMALVAERGNQRSVGDSAAFYAPSPSAAASILLLDKVRYVWVDERLPRLRTPTNAYFYGHEGPTYIFPPSADNLSNFAKIRGASKIYDDGTILIYDMRGIKP